jgi:hypothetical protein
MLAEILAEDVCPFGTFFIDGTFPGKVKAEAKLSRQKGGTRPKDKDLSSQGA